MGELNMMQTTFLMITVLCVLLPSPSDGCPPTVCGRNNQWKHYKKIIKQSHKELETIFKAIVGQSPNICPTFSLSCLSDNALEPPTSTRSFDECGLNCRANQDCEFWTMIPKSSTFDRQSEPLSDCWLLRNCNNPVPNQPGFVSGNRDCPPGE